MSDIPEFLDQDPIYDKDPIGSESTPWYQIWINAVTKPNVQTFREIANLPDAKPGTAYLWIFLVSLISAMTLLVAQSTLGVSMMKNQFSGYGMGTLPVEEIRSMYLGMLCILPFTSGLNVLGFMIGTALIQWIAGLFGGTGTYDKLVYPFGAIYAPFLIASSAIGFLGLIPYVGICFSIFSIGLWVYQIVLRILAVQAVNDLDTGKATLSVLLPGFVIFLFFCLCFALIFGGLLAMGPAIGDLFNGIVNDLVQEIY